MNLAETIHNISLEHCNNGGLIIGQCLSSVGRVNGTVPDHPNVIELPMTDVAGSGFACGMALAGRSPIFIMRFQDFSIINGSSLVNYAAKLKELHGIGCPIFIRAIASEYLGIVHSSILHSIICHFPGIKVVAPTSPEEYKLIWNSFVNDDCPYYVSEHRDTYKNTESYETNTQNQDIILMPISACVNEAKKAAYLLEDDGIKTSVWPLVSLKPFELSKNKMDILKNNKLVLVIDPSYEYVSIGSYISYKLMLGGCYAEVLSCTDNSKLLKEPFRNEYPHANKIYQKVMEIVRGREIGIYGMTTP
jgi:acetoin:2,6-dichlorophenolindophenol oxidoreductase subunit beta